jgi:hypothetical protein
MDIWSEILSLEPNRIRETFKNLKINEKIDVRAHLIQMSTVLGWHPEQVTSASIALEAIKDVPDT